MDCSLPGSSFLLTSSKVIQMLKISHRSPRCLFHRNCQKPYAAVSDGYNLLLSDGGCSEKNSNSRLEEDQFLVFVWSLFFCCCPFSIGVGFLPFHLDRLLLFQGRLLWLWTFRRLRRGSRPRFPPFNPSPKHLREEARENGLQRGTNLRSRLLCLLLLWGLSRLGLGWGSVRKAEPKAASRELSQRTGRSVPAHAPRRRKRPPLEVGDRVPDEIQRPAICDFQIMSNFFVYRCGKPR